MQDPSLHDEQLENEIKLVGDLVLAASQSEEPLPQEKIDEILGIPDEAAATNGDVRLTASGTDAVRARQRVRRPGDGRCPVSTLGTRHPPRGHSLCTH